MTVAVCIASRGRPEELRATIAKAQASAVDPYTWFSLALDDDDDLSGYAGIAAPSEAAPREDSLGAKYNRAVRTTTLDTTVFVLGVDDAALVSPGWDRRLLDAAAQFKDGVGVIYWGERRGPFCLPDGIAVTRGWIEKVGYFCPEHFPFWWHDTWIDELARMTGRFVWADVKWEKHGASEVGGHKTTRMREVSWWARFFDATRPQRLAKALDMLCSLDYPEWLRSQLISELHGTGGALRQRNSLLVEHGAQFERDYGAEYADDPGYDRLKRAAEEMLRQ
jgi:hypothetical protein